MVWFRKKKNEDGDKKKKEKADALKKAVSAKKESSPAKKEKPALSSHQAEMLKKKLAAPPVVQEKPKKKPVEIQPPTPPAAQPVAKRFVHERDLPDGYGDNHIYLMVRDPYWIFSYWEIQKENQEKALRELGGNWDGVSSILRIYDVSDKKNAPSHFDILIQGLAKSWYINVQPNRSYVVEIGLIDRNGRFAVLARSNEITTPRAGMSEVIDERWMGIDFDKMYALSGGFQVGKSSAELQKLMEERLIGAISPIAPYGSIAVPSSWLSDFFVSQIRFQTINCKKPGCLPAEKYYCSVPADSTSSYQAGLPSNPHKFSKNSRGDP